MADPTNTATPGAGGEDTNNYLTIALAVGIPCGFVIVALVIIISIVFYLTCKTSSGDSEAVYVHKRFQGISLEQQRQAQAKKRKKRRGEDTQRRESSVSGIFNPNISRSPSSVSAAARANPFGLQEWQVRMYGGAGPEGGSPDTVETDVSGNEGFQRRGSSGFPTGAINPLMVVQGQDHDPGYDTPPRRTHSHMHHLHTHTHMHTSQESPTHPPTKGQRRQKSEDTQEESSSDDSMNPYD